MNRSILLATLSGLLLVTACVLPAIEVPMRQEWWATQGPVISHETFPGDCELCHVGDDWQTLVETFEFDHAKETGFHLEGAHDRAQCLRCHNDRGPVQQFQGRGCAGCHEDVHLGELGANCSDCHDQMTWYPRGQFEAHRHTRFPLIGAHAATSCRRCHPGAELGRFGFLDRECSTCHADDLARANDPNHVGFGWVHSCDRCHLPTAWNQAELDPNFVPR